MKFKAAAVQMDCTLGDVPSNLGKTKSLVDAACAEGATLVALPELFSTGYRLDEDYHKFAQSVPGPTTEYLASLAATHNAYIAGTVIEEGVVRGIIYNTAVLVGPSGLIGKQAKIILYDREKIYFAPGDAVEPHETPFGPVGLLVCRDIGFPEISRALALKGAEILICSSAAGSIGVSTQARAADNSAYLIASNRIGKELDTNLGGDSRIIDPSGKVIVEAGKDEGYCLAELDTDVVAQTRLRRRNLQDYRPSLFLNPGFYRRA